MSYNHFSSELFSHSPQGSVSVRMPLLASVNSPTHILKFFVLEVLAQKLMSGNIQLNPGQKKVIRISFSSCVLVLCSLGLLPRCDKGGFWQFQTYILPCQEPQRKKCAFFPRGFFFPGGFIQSSGIGFHWVEAMTNARLMNASVGQTWAFPPQDLDRWWE